MTERREQDIAAARLDRGRLPRAALTREHGRYPGPDLTAATKEI